MSADGLPAGWDLDRVRAEPGDSDARLLSADAHLVVMDSSGETDYMELNPEVIIGFSGGLCLLREPDEPGWVMGEIEKDGSIMCWGYYGGDLSEAIQAL